MYDKEDEKLNQKDREGVLKQIAVLVFVLELIIFACTLLYQKDDQKHTEKPLTDEIANTYLHNPEKLKTNERLAISNLYGNQKAYLLIRDETTVVPFPWKGWILMSFGAPIAIFFMVLLFSKAYFQVIEPNEKEDDKDAGKWITALNSLNKINVIWIMLIVVAAIFLIWYVTEILKFAGKAAFIWLSNYWWILVIFFVIFALIIIIWIFLQYKLKMTSMQMEMEKFKYLQIDNKTRTFLLENSNTTNSMPLIEENPINPDEKE